MEASILNVEGFDPREWDIRREGRVWSHEEFNRRIDQAPEKIEYTGGIFTYEDERLTVLAMDHLVFRYFWRARRSKSEGNDYGVNSADCRIEFTHP